MFQGFSQETVDFLWGIRFNNERSWFEEHKQQYLDLLAAPMKELAVQTQQAMEEAYPKLQLQVKVSRIYRDARRLHGRGPYKDHLWFVLARPKSVASQGASPCLYFEIAPEYHSVGMGYYSATPLTMAKFRARVDRDPKPMERLARQLELQDRFVLEGPMYARPKGNPGKLLEPWYNRKSLAVCWDRNCEGSLFTPQLAQEVLESFRFLMPYYQYFDGLEGDASPD